MDQWQDSIASLPVGRITELVSGGLASLPVSDNALEHMASLLASSGLVFDTEIQNTTKDSVCSNKTVTDTVSGNSLKGRKAEPLCSGNRFLIELRRRK